jgi:hypothetical protein
LVDGAVLNLVVECAKALKMDRTKPGERVAGSCAGAAEHLNTRDWRDLKELRQAGSNVAQVCQQRLGVFERLV